jgi:hypothetical protein
MRLVFAIALACAVATTVFSSSALASFTTINAPYFANEEARNQIFSTVYGGTFTPTAPGSLDYSNGTLTAVRVEDINSAPGALPLSDPYGNGSPDDQLWQADFKLASAKAIFGAYNQEFGYIDGASGGSYVKLFDASGWAYGVTGGADISSLSGHTLRWARGGESRVFSSKNSDNPDGLDHMVTYSIRGLGGNQLTWLVMWEDKLPGEPYADFDYNDLVVQITATAVPEPAAVSAMLGLGALTTLRRRRTK